MFSTTHESEILLLMACKTTTTTKTHSSIQDACGDRPNCRTAGQGLGWRAAAQRPAAVGGAQLHLLRLIPFAHQKAGMWEMGRQGPPWVTADPWHPFWKALLRAGSFNVMMRTAWTQL